VKKHTHQTGRTGGKTKVETLNRARLDALGAMMQASHQLEEAENTLNKAQNLFLSCSRTLEKADGAFQACLERLAKTKPSKIPQKGGRHG